MASTINIRLSDGGFAFAYPTLEGGQYYMNLRGKRVLVMGLGLQGSGMASARYAAQQGAIVRVTDMKSPEVLAPSVQALAGLPIEFVLGQHREEDFRWAGIVVWHPGSP